MIDRLRKLLGRSDPAEDLISAYVDSSGETDPDRIEELLNASGVDLADARSIRETSQLLRSLDTVEAPRSYALTPDTLAERGYSDREIEKILDPRSSAGGFRLRNATVFVPLAIVAIALMGVALITIGDLSEYVTDRFDPLPGSPEGPGAVVIQTVEVEKEVVAEVEKMVAEAPAELSIQLNQGESGLADPPASVRTVVVEKEVIITVVVEKEVAVMGETAVQTVEVIVEREVVVEKLVPVTVVIEKLVEVEKEVVREVEVVKEVEVERVIEVEKEVILDAEPAPTPLPETMAEAAVSEAQEAAEESTEPPKDSPCAIIPTPVATPSVSPEVSATPEPTPTVLPIPTCTPTPTPTATPSQTPTR